MKALPPPSPQLQLAICRNQPLVILSPEARSEALRALAEILLIAAGAALVPGRAQAAEGHDEAP
jgi:hypothetical protein